jgi:hypothetical protein
MYQLQLESFSIILQCGLDINNQNYMDKNIKIKQFNKNKITNQIKIYNKIFRISKFKENQLLLMKIKNNKIYDLTFF